MLKKTLTRFIRREGLEIEEGTGRDTNGLLLFDRHLLLTIFAIICKKMEAEVSTILTFAFAHC